MHYIGTKGKTAAYSNPHSSSGGVGVYASSSSSYVGKDETIVEWSTEKFYCTGDQIRSWVKVDLGKNRLLSPTHYTFQHGWPCTGTKYMRNWRLEGSLDDAHWVTLRYHRNDNTICRDSGDGSFGSWPITYSGNGFRYFRVVSTGENSHSSNRMLVKSLEFYGVYSWWQSTSFWNFVNIWRYILAKKWFCNLLLTKFMPFAY